MYMSTSYDASTDCEDVTTSFESIQASNKATPSASAFTSEITGPSMDAWSYAWVQKYFPTTVGTVMMTVNEATNQTAVTTMYHSEFQANGSIQMITNTNTNAAGTQTAAVQGVDGLNTTVAYPTPVMVLGSVMIWTAVLPTVQNASQTCCRPQTTSSPTPSHTPFIAEPGSTDPVDPKGWLYTLAGYQDSGEAETYLNGAQVSSYWPGQALTVPYTGCPYSACPPTWSAVAGPVGVFSTAVNILDTVATTISSASKTTAKESSRSAPEQTPVETETPISSPSDTSTAAVTARTSSQGEREQTPVHPDTAPTETPKPPATSTTQASKPASPESAPEQTPDQSKTSSIPATSSPASTTAQAEPTDARNPPAATTPPSQPQPPSNSVLAVERPPATTNPSPQSPTNPPPSSVSDVKPAQNTPAEVPLGWFVPYVEVASATATATTSGGNVAGWIWIGIGGETSNGNESGAATSSAAARPKATSGDIGAYIRSGIGGGGGETVAAASSSGVASSSALSTDRASSSSSQDEVPTTSTTPSSSRSGNATAPLTQPIGSTASTIVVRDWWIAAATAALTLLAVG